MHQESLSSIAEAAPSSPLVWSEGLARALVNNAADAVMVLTASHTCLFANPAIRDSLGYAPEEVLGQHVIPLHHPDDLPLASAMLDEAAAHPGQPARCEVRLMHRNGSWRWMAVSAMNGLDDPAIRGIVCNLRDVTVRKEAALATARAMEEQETARRDLEQVVHARSDFLRLLNHEFKTPLTAIAGNAELIEMEYAGDAALIESVQVIKSEAWRLANLIAELLLSDREDATGLLLRRQPADLNALAANAVARLREQYPDREIQLALAAHLPPIDVDAQRILQAIGSLAGNAIKFSPEGGPVTITTASDGNALLLSVADTGVGIPAGELDSIFTRYSRARSGPVVGVARSGVGLSVVRDIVELHGGKVWAESVEGQGSIFYLRLPGASSQ